MLHHQNQLLTPNNYQLVHLVVNWRDVYVTFLGQGIHLNPHGSDLNLEPDVAVAGKRPRLQGQAVLFMAAFGVQSPLSDRPGPSFSKHVTVKRPAEK